MIAYQNKCTAGGDVFLSGYLEAETYLAKDITGSSGGVIP
jgi:hypothetical protein